MTKRIEADGERQTFRSKPGQKWKCLTCHHELENDAQGVPIPCPLPQCVENRLRSVRRMSE